MTNNTEGKQQLKEVSAIEPLISLTGDIEVFVKAPSQNFSLFSPFFGGGVIKRYNQIDVGRKQTENFSMGILTKLVDCSRCTCLPD